MIRFFLLTALTAIALSAQEGVLVEFTEQYPQWNMQNYAVRICNKTSVAQNFSSALIRNAAEARGLRPASYSTIERNRQREQSLDARQILLSVGEATGYVLGALTATNSIWKQRPDWLKSLPLVISGSVRVATVIVDRHAESTDPPADLIPVNIHLAPGDGECVEYTMFMLGDR